MKQVSRFQTDDGQEFDNKEEAKMHEVFCESKKDLIETLRPAYNTDRADAILISVLHNAQVVRDLLNRHLRRQPHQKPEA